MRRAILTLPLMLLLAQPALAQVLRVLSAGAVEPGLAAAVEAFRRNAGLAVDVTYAPAQRLRELVAAGQAPDLLIAPVALVNELAGAGRLAGERATLGRVGVGVVVRGDAPVPGIEDAAALRGAVEAAERVVFNRASTGLHMERLFDRWGITDAVAAKATRFATGAEVMEHLLHGGRLAIGFGAITEIRLVPALRFVGPLPAEIQKYTSYAATLLPGSAPGAAELFTWLAGPQGRAAFDAAGIEAAP